MNQDFPLDRYNFLNLIEYIRSIKELPTDITDGETGIEFYHTDTVSKNELIDLLENFNTLDNLAQDDALQDYVHHKQFGVESYQFEPSWVEIAHNKIVIGYVGSYVNTDFELVFSKINGQWVFMK